MTKYVNNNSVSEMWLNIKNWVTSQLLGYSQTGHTHSASDITSGLSNVATSGSYNDLSNKPTIPTVNNATLKIQKNGTDVKTFTANASSDVTCNITVPTKVSELTNDSGFLTSHQSLSNYVTSSNLSTALSDKVDRIDHGYKQITGNGTYSWCKLATITIKSSYINNPISFEIDGRGRERSILQVLFASVSNNDPSLTSFKSDLDTNFYIKKVATSTWELYGNYNEVWGSFTLYRVTSSINSDSVAIDTTLSNLSSAPSGTTRVSLNISVPTKTSQLTNDSGFLTSHQSLSNYSTLANTVKSLSISGKTITVTPGSGNAYTLTTQDTTYTLPTASSTLGGVKTTSTVSNSSGYTACPIINGVPYYKDTNTTYSLSSLGIGNVKNYDQSKAIKSISRRGTTFTYTCLDGTTGTFTQQDNNTTYSFSDKNVTLAWGTKSTIATVGGTDIHVTMPANPNTNTTYSAGAGLSLSGTKFSRKLTAISTRTTSGKWTVSVTAYVPVYINGTGSSSNTNIADVASNVHVLQSGHYSCVCIPTGTSITVTIGSTGSSSFTAYQ